MASRTWRFVAPLVALAVLGACGGGDDDAQVGESLTSDSTTSSAPETGTSTEDTTTTTATADEPDGTVVEVKLVGGRPEGGVQRAAVKVGETVILRVTSDTGDEVHVHTYDLEFAVGPGTAGELTFDATIPGVFEVELHDAGREILKLEVSP